MKNKHELAVSQIWEWKSGVLTLRVQITDMYEYEISVTCLACSPGMAPGLGGPPSYIVNDMYQFNKGVFCTGCWRLIKDVDRT